jgi:hypothetical protein
MRRRNNNSRRYDSWPEERYVDPFGSRNYRTGYEYIDGPWGNRQEQYADEEFYYPEERRYYSERWYNDSHPYEESLRDEYDRYGVGLSRGRYHGEPYGRVEHSWRNRHQNGPDYYPVDRRDRGDDHRGFFGRVGERIHNAWDHIRHRDRDERERAHDREQRGSERQGNRRGSRDNRR